MWGDRPYCKNRSSCIQNRENVGCKALSNARCVTARPVTDVTHKRRSCVWYIDLHVASDKRRIRMGGGKLRRIGILTMEPRTTRWPLLHYYDGVTTTTDGQTHIRLRRVHERSTMAVKLMKITPDMKISGDWVLTTGHGDNDRYGVCHERYAYTDARKIHTART